jgi:membrane protein YqaA with SNARE-associated domain
VEELALRPFLLRSAVALVVLVAAVAGGMALYGAQLTAAAGWFVGHLGGPGILVGFIFTDGFGFPFPQDAFTGFGLVGGLPFWEVVGWGTVGSYIGGLVGYLVGGQLRSTRLYQRVMRLPQARRAAALIRQNAALALWIEAFTPIPYWVVAWICGATEVGLGRFALLGLPIRPARVAFYLWLIQIGALKVLHLHD